MTGKTHQVIGLSAGLAVFLWHTPVLYQPATVGAVLVAAHLASLLPDIDQPASSFWRALPFGRVGGELVNPFLQHRNLTHSLVGVALAGWLIWRLAGFFPTYWGINPAAVWLSAMAAYVSHLLADMVTVEGIPLFFPWGRMYGLPPWPLAGLRMETGKWFESLVVFPLANLALIGLIWQSWPILRLMLFH